MELMVWSDLCLRLSQAVVAGKDELLRAQERQLKEQRERAVALQQQLQQEYAGALDRVVRGPLHAPRYMLPIIPLSPPPPPDTLMYVTCQPVDIHTNPPALFLHSFTTSQSTPVNLTFPVSVRASSPSVYLLSTVAYFLSKPSQAEPSRAQPSPSASFDRCLLSCHCVVQEKELGDTKAALKKAQGDAKSSCEKAEAELHQSTLAATELRSLLTAAQVGTLKWYIYYRTVRCSAVQWGTVQCSILGFCTDRFCPLGYSRLTNNHTKS